MKNKIIVFLFIGYLGLFSILGIIFSDKEISNSERRKLSSFPEIEFSSDYITDVDKYFLDHFPFRDSFRSIKANYNYKILGMLDNNGIYLKDNYIFKSGYPTNRKSISNFITHVKKMSSLFPNSNIYTMIVPDKNYYLDDSNFLNIDYNYIYEEVSNLGTFIDIREVLELDDYYETDAFFKLVSFLENNPEYASVRGNVINRKEEDLSIIKNKIRRGLTIWLIYLNLLSRS